jgi:hypothetical protein
MKFDDDMLPALKSVGEQLHEAAQRKARAAERRRRRRRRVLVVAISLLLLAAAVAGAARLIAVGDPVEDRRDLPAELAPDGPGQMVVEAADPAGGLPWAARVYTSRDGRDCILAGRRRGASLGVIRDGVFRPFAPETRGVCADLERVRVFLNAETFPEPTLRTIVYGRARPGIVAVRVFGPGEPRRVRVGSAGSFLLVYDRRVPATEIRVDPE